MPDFDPTMRPRTLTMPRALFPSRRLILLAFATLATAATLAGCSVGRGGAAAPGLARYDFGALPDSTASASVHLPTPIRVVAVSAPSALSSDAFQYRLRYADDRQAHAYADSRWTEPPPQLFSTRLRDQIARQGHVLDSSDGGPAVPVLKVELDEFAQVFDQPGTSQGVVRLRATLLHGNALIAQQSFTVSSPAATADAAGGAQALSVASDTAISQILMWLAAQNP